MQQTLMSKEHLLGMHKPQKVGEVGFLDRYEQAPAGLDSDIRLIKREPPGAHDQLKNVKRCSFRRRLCRHCW